jgi:hypothetical protein
VQIQFAETFWALRFEMVVDRFGMPWLIMRETCGGMRTPAAGRAYRTFGKGLPFLVRNLRPTASMGTHTFKG